MPPLPDYTHTALGWKAFFALLAILQVIVIGVVWRTYDAVSTTARLAERHEYQISEELKPAIRELQGRPPR